MMARGHVASGVMVGAVSSLALPDLGISGVVPWVIAVAGASILPDIDMPGSTVSRMWGPISSGISIGRGTGIRIPGISSLVSLVSGGHRAGTHSVAGVIAVAVLFGLLSLHPVGIGIATAFATGITLAAVGALIPGKQQWEYWPVNLGISVLVGVGAVVSPIGPVLQYLWLAMAVGTATHILGDMLTKQGCPLWYPFSPKRDRFLKLRAGGKWEWVAIAVFLFVAASVLTLGYGPGGPELLDQLAM